MVDVQKNADQLKAELPDSSPILDTLTEILGKDIRPKVDEILSTFESIRQTVESLNAATQAISALPFINIPEITQGTQNLVDLLNEIDDGIYDLNTGVEEIKQSITEKVIQPIQDQAVLVEEEISEARGEIQKTQRDAETAYQVIVLVRPRIPQIIDVVSLIITLQLLWAVLANLALIYLAWLFIKTGHLDLHNLLSGESVEQVEQYEASSQILEGKNLAPSEQAAGETK